MCVRGFLPLTLPSKPLLGAERGQNPPLLPRQMGSEGCRPGDPAEPPLCPAPHPRGLNHGLGVGSPPLTCLYTERIGRQPHKGWGRPPPPNYPLSLLSG